MLKIVQIHCNLSSCVNFLVVTNSKHYRIKICYFYSIVIYVFRSLYLLMLSCVHSGAVFEFFWREDEGCGCA